MQNLAEIEKRLWAAADELRANSGLRAADYSTPVLGLLFLRYADYKFTLAEQELEGKGSGRRAIGKDDYVKKIGFFLPATARFTALLKLPEGGNLGQHLNDAMKDIERENDNLKDVLPRNYNKVDNLTLAALLKVMNSIPMDVQGDAFGQIYEYFLAEFAKSEGQKGGEFYTPRSLVELIVNVLEPFEGRILDPACGSGGMFVQSARFVEEHKGGKLSIYGQEKEEHTVRLAKMNLAVHGLEGDIRQGNSYYEPLYQQASGGKGFDYVLANPPFNVNSINKERLTDDKRFSYGLPTVDSGNYLWIEMFASALNAKGRAGFVMANSASDARGSEQAIRQKIIKDGLVDVMVAIGSNFFYTVTLPCTLWFLDKGKKGTPREDKILFIDARHLFRRVTRAVRDFTPAQMEFISNIVRLYRGQKTENRYGSETLLTENFPAGSYENVAGLCMVSRREEVLASASCSLNPGRYVGATEVDATGADEFAEALGGLIQEFAELNGEAHGLETTIEKNTTVLLGGR
jgi:type I restriction enzyme M protein